MDLVIIKGNQIVQTNLNIYLRGSVLAQYTAELLNLERSSLRTKNLTTGQCDILKKRFKEPTGKAAS